MDVTVTGGAGNPPITLQYNSDSMALSRAKLLAASIDDTFSSAKYYSQLNPPTTTGAAGGYLIAKAADIGNTLIDAQNFQAVVIQNTGMRATVLGGGNAAQTVLASDGGLNFSALSGNTTVVAGGGANAVSFAGGSGRNAVYTSRGNDSIVGGNGFTTIFAGAGHNAITLGGGQTHETVLGRDTIRLGSGAETIRAIGPGSALIQGAASVAGPAGLSGGLRHFTLDFVGAASASTILSGAGSYSVNGGAGGGLFQGGTAGGNVIRGGTGDVTIFGGGTGDILQGGLGTSSINAGSGNETLIGGDGASTLTGAGTAARDVFSFRPDGNLPGVTDTVTNFTHGFDFINVEAYADAYGVNEEQYVRTHFQVSGGNGSFTLQDGTKVVLDGVTHLTNGDFR